VPTNSELLVLACFLVLLAQEQAGKCVPHLFRRVSFFSAVKSWIFSSEGVSKMRTRKRLRERKRTRTRRRRFSPVDVFVVVDASELCDAMMMEVDLSEGFPLPHHHITTSRRLSAFASFHLSSVISAHSHKKALLYSS